jgi:hypothetical protein
MKDPLRITETNPGELEGDLIASMQGDRPSRRARDRTIAALGLGTAALGASSTTTAALASKGATVATVIAFGKWVALGVGAGALMVGLVHRPPQAPPAAPPAARPTIEVAPPVEPASAGHADTEPVPSAVAPTPSIKSSLSRKPKPDLTDEIALLDRVHEATRAGDPRGALELLGSYPRRFPRGALAPEATMLRIEALAASGQKSAAMALARQVLAASPTSPHAERLQAMAAGDFAP